MVRENTQQPFDRWIRRQTASPAPAVRLFCFHYANGSASMYRGWPDHLPGTVSVEAVQLPGRDNRFREKPYDRMSPLVDDVVDALRSRIDLPYALFGYSMGAQVAFNVAHGLCAAGFPAPLALFVAASPAPSLQVEVPAWNESDERLLQYMHDMGGLPADILEHPDLLELMLPTLRADLTVVATWPYLKRAALPTAIHAFAGTSDPDATPARMASWSLETTAGFRETILDGGHFFIEKTMPTIVAEVTQYLATPDVSLKQGFCASSCTRT